MLKGLFKKNKLEDDATEVTDMSDLDEYEEIDDDEESSSPKKTKQSNKLRLVLLVALAGAGALLLTEEDDPSSKPKTVQRKKVQNPSKNEKVETNRLQEPPEPTAGGPENAQVKQESKLLNEDNSDEKNNAFRDQKTVEKVDLSDRKLSDNQEDIESTSEEVRSIDVKSSSSKVEEGEVLEVKTDELDSEKQADLSEGQSELSADPPKRPEKASSDDKDEPLKFVPPPNYELLGRGLVYNCEVGHWSCVNRPSYYQCKNHHLWAVQNNKKPDCVELDVYVTDEDCAIVQVHHINTLKKVPQCQ